MSDEFELVGEIEDVLQIRNLKSRVRHNWNNFYLVSKKISRLFNFNDFANDLDRRINERIRETYSFNFKSYLLSFSTSTHLYVLNEISEVAEKILNSEFGIYIDTDDNINFRRSSSKQVYEYAYEALKLLGKPSKINEITKKVEELHRDYETNDAKMRTAMQRDSSFVPIGRTSTFGLKEWENELENFKGGTIRNIVSKYLESEIEPKHISDIAEYVLNYRPNTYERSILDNLKADETRTFVFFKNSTIGLNSKKYDSSFVELNQIESIESKSWEERYNDFAQFLNLNNRLPYSSGCPKKEIKLYRWYKIQVRKTKNGIEEDKSNLINELIKTFEKGEFSLRTSTNNIGGRKRGSNSKYKDLTEFININKRMPDSRDPNESSLYRFYNRNKNNLENIDALSAQQEKLVELIDKFGSSKNSKYATDELIEFININKRMPDSRDSNERSLYQFYYRNKKNLENIDVLTAQEEKLVELIDKFGSSKNSKYAIDELIEFVNINKRMPDSRDPNESSLYHFYYRNKKNLENIDALSAQEEKLVELIEKFGSFKHPKYTIDELMEFIKINKRMPDSRTTNERGLYQFLYKQRKLFEQGELEQSEENQYVEIAKIIQSHKYENKRK